MHADDPGVHGAPFAAPRPPRGAILRRALVGLLVLAALGGGGWWLWQRYGRAWWEGRQASRSVRPTYTVRPRDLSVAVEASGSLKALDSEVIASQVEGRTTILDIVPEGTVITQEDVKKGRPLVELDSSELEDRLVAQQITFANAEADYTQAKEAYDIQQSQVESDTHAARLNVRFGRLDLERYVGEALAAQALADEVDLMALARQHADAARKQRTRVEAEVQDALAHVEAELRKAVAARAKRTEGNPHGPAAQEPPAGAPAPNPGTEAPLRSETLTATGRMGSAARSEEGLPPLGGAALQSKRTLEGDIDLAIEEFKRAADKVVWTARAWSKGYVSQNELEADQLAVKRGLIKLEQALAARDLFLRYEFPKEAEQFLSVYREAVREQGRVEARGRASLAQKEADRRSKEATYLRQKDKLEKLTRQVRHCTIRAKKPGIVVYASSHDRRRRSSQPIDKGVAVHEQQELLRIPNLASLAVSVGIHESVVGKVRKGLPVDIRIDALPNVRLRGRVQSVAPLPSPKHWWNRDYMEFDTEIAIEGDLPPGLKPGMSASVVIEVRMLKGVLAVPVQAVRVAGGRRVVYVVEGDREVAREVELGESNDKLVEVRSGLQKGERILAQAPHAARTEGQKHREAAPKEAEDKDGPRPRPVAAGKSAEDPKAAGRSKSADAPAKRPSQGGRRPAAPPR